MNTLLAVQNLTIRFITREGLLTAVDNLSFRIARGETLAMVGESGCGKSVTAMALMGLLPQATTRVEGQVVFNGKQLLTLPEPEFRNIRGKDMSMIFQEPMTSLNPVLSIGFQIDEALAAHTDMSAPARAELCLELLESVRIADAAQVLREYPHRLSGGMRQRVMIAMAVACNPQLLIADEPTTALDVTMQAQVLMVMRLLKEALNMSVLLITHDLGVVGENADRVGVMYGGRLMELAPARELFALPLHPYTQGLMQASPHVAGNAHFRTSRLTEIPGNVPALAHLPAGCPFVSRCARRLPLCDTDRPELRPVAACGQDDAHTVACFAVNGTNPEIFLSEKI